MRAARIEGQMSGLRDEKGRKERRKEGRNEGRKAGREDGRTDGRNDEGWTEGNEGKEARKDTYECDFIGSFMKS